jgi:CheY-like chemotaxis protein
MSERGLKTVLVVEDNRDHMFLIQRAFKKTGLSCAVNGVTNGDQAIEYLSGTGLYADRTTYPLPDLVLLDLKLPRRSGFDVLSWLRQQQEIGDTPVVILTTSDQAMEIRRAHQCGANAYVVKPVDTEKMVTTVRSLGEFWLGYHNRARS